MWIKFSLEQKDIKKKLRYQQFYCVVCVSADGLLGQEIFDRRHVKVSRLLLANAALLTLNAISLNTGADGPDERISYVRSAFACNKGSSKK